MMKMKVCTVPVFVFLLANAAIAQQEAEAPIKIPIRENPMRLGIKLGVPNVFGFHAEYLTSHAGGRLAPSVDFSRLSVSDPDSQVNEKSDITYLEAGVNYYFKDTGRGAYANLSYGFINMSCIEETGTLSSSDLNDTNEERLMGNLLNLKLGVKLGNHFYFRPELGYTILLYGTEKLKYFDELQNTTIREEKSHFFDICIIANVGIGLAF